MYYISACVYIYICICMCVYIYIYIHTYTHICCCCCCVFIAFVNCCIIIVFVLFCGCPRVSAPGFPAVPGTDNTVGSRDSELARSQIEGLESNIQTYRIRSNHSRSSIVLRKYMHARIESPRVWKEKYIVEPLETGLMGMRQYARYRNAIITAIGVCVRVCIGCASGIHTLILIAMANPRAKISGSSREDGTTRMTETSRSVECRPDGGVIGCGKGWFRGLAKFSSDLTVPHRGIRKGDPETK